MAFRNPILAGEIMVVPALRSDNYVEGVDGWRLARTGEAEFENATVRDTLFATHVEADSYLIGAYDLGYLLDSKGGNFVLKANGTGSGDTAEISAATLTFYSGCSVYANRDYLFMFRAQVVKTVATDTFIARLRYTTDGVNPGPGVSDIFTGSMRRLANGALEETVELWGRYHSNVNSDVFKVGVTLERSAGTGTARIRNSGAAISEWPTLMGMDLGRHELIPDNGLTQTSPAPAPEYSHLVTHTFYPTWARTFDNDGAPTAPGVPAAYDLSQGNFASKFGIGLTAARSAFGGFQRTTGEPLYAALAGATDVTIDLWVKCAYSTESKTTFKIGTGLHLDEPADFDDITNKVARFDLLLASNQSKSTVLSAGVVADFLAENIDAITVGPAPITTDNKYRGHLHGLDTAGVVPYLSVTYIPLSQGVGTENCFVKLDNAALAVDVWQIAPPPANNTVDATYPHWPMTHCTSASKTVGTSTWDEGSIEPFVWVNRRNTGGWNRKPNDLPGDTVTVLGRECRSTYTTIGLANAATRIQLRAILGMDYSSILAANPGITAVYDYETWQADDGTIFAEEFPLDPTHFVTTVYRVCEDVVLLHPYVIDGSAQYTGVVMDYEPGDDRAVATTNSFMALLRADVHSVSKTIGVWTNPLTASSLVHHGLDATNLPTIFDDIDTLSVQLFSGVGATEGTDIPQSYADQVALLGVTPDLTKVMIVFELGLDQAAANPGTTLTDAQWVFDLLHDPINPHPNKVMFWRNWATPGGDCLTESNRKIKRVCYGT